MPQILGNSKPQTLYNITLIVPLYYPFKDSKIRYPRIGFTVSGCRLRLVGQGAELEGCRLKELRVDDFFSLGFRSLWGLGFRV